MKRLCFLIAVVCLLGGTAFANENPKSKTNSRTRKSVAKTIKNLCSFAITAPKKRDEGGPCPSFSTCLNGCLKEVGVSVTTLALCGGSCGTGNVPLCALCIGWSAATVATCGLGCSAYPCGVGTQERQPADTPSTQ